MKLTNDYLCEEKLGQVLEIIYPKEKIIHNKKIPGYRELCRPDYRLPNLKLIFEFDGSTHFTNPKRIIMDEKNDTFYKSLGYRVIRIPYFIQMDSNFFKNILNLELENLYYYPNGFIDNKATLPAEFCGMGIQKYYSLIDSDGIFNYCYSDIYESIKNKIDFLGDARLVIPPFVKHG